MLEEKKGEQKMMEKFYDFYWDGILRSEIGNSLPSFHSLPRFRRLFAFCTEENGFYDFINFSAEKSFMGDDIVGERSDSLWEDHNLLQQLSVSNNQGITLAIAAVSRVACTTKAS